MRSQPVDQAREVRGRRKPARHEERLKTPVGASKQEDALRWQAVAPKLLDSDFCTSVENGTFAEKVESWR